MSDEPSPKRLIITRVFDAPRQTVWAAWTKPEQFAEWWSPDMFTIPTCELDVRPEGKIYLEMRGPDGVNYPMAGTYQEVVEPQRLVMLNTPLDANGKPLFEILQTATFDDTDGKTTLTIVSEVMSAGPDAAPFLEGMEAGLNQCLGKLEKLLQG